MCLLILIFDWLSANNKCLFNHTQVTSQFLVLLPSCYCITQVRFLSLLTLVMKICSMGTPVIFQHFPQHTKLRKKVNFSKILTPEKLNHHVIQTKLFVCFLFKLTNVDCIVQMMWVWTFGARCWNKPHQNNCLVLIDNKCSLSMYCYLLFSDS